MVFWAFVTAFGLSILGFLIYVGYRIQNSEKQFISISIIALIVGVLFESKRIMDKWEIVSIALGSLFLSLLVFLRDIGNYAYNFENNIAIWPYCFILSYIILSVTFHGDKVMTKLTEGITLLQSLAVIYWVIDYGFLETESFALRFIMMIGLLFSVYSIFHACTHTVLSKRNRILLSIWSTFIMLLLSFDNIYRMYQNGWMEIPIERISFLIVLQFFLLGISSVYIVQNIGLLFGYLPGKNRFFNKEYYRDIKELNTMHVTRYSKEQVSISYSVFCILLISALFTLNYYYQFLSRNIAIWVMFFAIPYFLMGFDFIRTRFWTKSNL